MTTPGAEYALLEAGGDDGPRGGVLCPISAADAICRLGVVSARTGERSACVGDSTAADGAVASWAGRVAPAGCCRGALLPKSMFSTVNCSNCATSSLIMKSSCILGRGDKSPLASPSRRDATAASSQSESPGLSPQAGSPRLDLVGGMCRSAVAEAAEGSSPKGDRIGGEPSSVRARLAPLAGVRRGSGCVSSWWLVSCGNNVDADACCVVSAARRGGVAMSEAALSVALCAAAVASSAAATANAAGGAAQPNDVDSACGATCARTIQYKA